MRGCAKLLRETDRQRWRVVERYKEIERNTEKGRERKEVSERDWCDRSCQVLVR